MTPLSKYRDCQIETCNSFILSVLSFLVVFEIREKNEWREEWDSRFRKRNESLVFNLIPVTATLILSSVSGNCLTYLQTQMYSRLNEPPVIHLPCVVLSAILSRDWCDQDLSCCLGLIFRFLLFHSSFRKRDEGSLHFSPAFSIVFQSLCSITRSYLSTSCVMFLCLP